MPRGRPTFTGIRWIKPGRQTRLKIPQAPARPVKVRASALLRRLIYQPEPWWMLIHRRGPKRDRVGEDPNEARAVPHDQVRGTLPERIEYKYLTDILNFSPIDDFDFQSSLDGGRLEFGGIVADFIFEWMKIIIRVQGPTHSDFLRFRKDEEQLMALEEMGYTVYDIEVSALADAYQTDEVNRKIFSLGPKGGGGGAFGPHETQDPLLLELVDRVVRIEAKVTDLQGAIL